MSDQVFLDLQLGGVGLYNGSARTLDTSDSLSGSLHVEGAGTALTVNRDLSLTDDAFVQSGGSAKVDGGSTFSVEPGDTLTDSFHVYDTGSILDLRKRRENDV